MNSLHQWILDVSVETQTQLRLLDNQDPVSNAKMVELLFSFPEEHRPLLASNKNVMSLYFALANVAHAHFSECPQSLTFALDRLMQASDPYVWGIV